jgi:hypothetical protein
LYSFSIIYTFSIKSERIVMSIFEKIKAELSKEYEKSNQEKLAQKGKVSQVTIGRYLANIENIKAMRLDCHRSVKMHRVRSVENVPPSLS